MTPAARAASNSTTKLYGSVDAAAKLKITLYQWGNTGNYSK